MHTLLTPLNRHIFPHIPNHVERHQKHGFLAWARVTKYTGRNEGRVFRKPQQKVGNHWERHGWCWSPWVSLFVEWVWWWRACLGNKQKCKGISGNKKETKENKTYILEKVWGATSVISWGFPPCLSAMFPKKQNRAEVFLWRRRRRRRRRRWGFHCSVLLLILLTR